MSEPTKAPAFTDTHRFRAPYVPAVATDIRATFERARAQHKTTRRKEKRA